MTRIKLTTVIDAPIERCFDLARSIDFHTKTTEQTNEKAIAGITSGLIWLNETVTWEAKHFGIRQKLTTRINEFAYPTFFSDEMVKGAFKSIYHKHLFNFEKGKTIMIDEFDYEVPFGLIGKLFDYLVLNSYMKKLLLKRNSELKHKAESDGWKKFLI